MYITTIVAFLISLFLINICGNICIVLKRMKTKLAVVFVIFFFRDYAGLIATLLSIMSFTRSIKVKYALRQLQQY
jgi:hypothetical protein